jgi:pyruvate,orthophosphate dikinase
VGSGLVVLDAEEARNRAERGEAVVLARPDSSPDDVIGMLAATAVLTERGGPASHAAVVCRELSRPAVVDCGPATVTALAGTWVTVDGTRGEVWAGEVPVDVSAGGEGPEFAVLRGWAAALRTQEGPVTRERLPAGAASAPRGTCGDAPEPEFPAANAPPTPSEPAGTNSVDRRTFLRILGLKGAALPDTVAAALDVPAEELKVQIAGLCSDGLCEERGRYLRLTDAGRSREREVLAAERAGADTAVVERCHAEFRPHNGVVKQAVTEWQAGDPGEALARLGEIHRRLDDLFTLLGELPLSTRRYPVRLSRALHRAETGERNCVAEPTIDSYHTIWFELHQDLLDLAGLDRANEVR